MRRLVVSGCRLWVASAALLALANAQEVNTPAGITTTSGEEPSALTSAKSESMLTDAPKTSPETTAGYQSMTTTTMEPATTASTEPTPAPGTEPTPAPEPKPSDLSGSCPYCIVPEVYQNTTDTFDECCQDHTIKVKAKSDISNVKCENPPYTPPAKSPTYYSGCMNSFQLYFMLDVRAPSNDCEDEDFCNLRTVKNSEMVQTWIFRIVYTIQLFKERLVKNKSPQQDFMVVIQYPNSDDADENYVHVTYADKILSADASFADELMKRHRESQKKNSFSRQDRSTEYTNKDLLNALSCTTEYVTLVNDDATTDEQIDKLKCMKFIKPEMIKKRPGAGSKKMLFTVTQGAIIVDEGQSQTAKDILEKAKATFDRMDVVTIQYRDNYSGKLSGELFQSPEGITYEYEDYPDMLSDRAIENVVSNVCEDLGDREQSVSKNALANTDLVDNPCLYDIVFAVDANWCSCGDTALPECCQESEKIFNQMSIFIKSVADKIRKSAGYTLGEGFDSAKHALRVAMYAYYKHEVSNDLKAVKIMELNDWAAVGTTTSLDAFRRNIYESYKPYQNTRTARSKRIYIREVLESSFQKEIYATPDHTSDVSFTFKSLFSQDSVFSSNPHATHTRSLLVFPADDASESENDSDFDTVRDVSANIQLRDAVYDYLEDKVNVIAMPIKSDVNSNRGLNYDVGVVNSILKKPPTDRDWTVLEWLDEQPAYDDERAERLVEAIVELDGCAPKRQSPQGKPVKFNCSADVKYTFRGCIMGPPGQKGEDGNPGAPGKKGIKGMPGPAGAGGERGDNGQAGGRGKPGDAGDKGPEGRIGTKGIPGIRGDQGAPGDKGDNAKAKILSWMQVKDIVNNTCGCKQCEEAINDPNNICERPDGSKCLTKVPTWWLNNDKEGFHTGPEYFRYIFKKFLDDKFAQQAVDNLLIPDCQGSDCVYKVIAQKEQWKKYIEDLGNTIFGGKVNFQTMLNKVSSGLPNDGNFSM